MINNGLQDEAECFAEEGTAGECGTLQQQVCTSTPEAICRLVKSLCMEAERM